MQRMASLFGLLNRIAYSKFEEIRWARAIDSHKLSAPPIFIIGHWGSGTTYLHHLLSNDPNLGFLDFGNALMPWNIFDSSRLFRLFIRPLIPANRRFDDVTVGLEEPQEEEMALACMNAISFFNTFYFPQEIEAHTRKSLFLEDLKREEREAFESAYELLARRMSLRRDGKRLLFKSPASTTRMPVLRRIFPGAKFLHIVRNPFEVFASAVNRLPVLFAEFALQRFDDVKLEPYILDTYEAVMRRFLTDRDPSSDDLVETRFELLTADPVGEIGKAYASLAIPGWDRSRAAIENYLAKRPAYTRSPRVLTPSQVAAIRNRWAFAFETWNYSLDPNAAGIAVAG